MQVHVNGRVISRVRIYRHPRPSVVAYPLESREVQILSSASVIEIFDLRVPFKIQSQMGRNGWQRISLQRLVWALQLRAASLQFGCAEGYLLATGDGD
jgi:hypothetical protein